MKKTVFAIAVFLCAGMAHAAESLNDWGPWAVDYDAASPSAYNVEDYDQGVEQQIPLASDLENSFTPIGPIESVASDPGGFINDVIDDVQDVLPNASPNDIVANFPAGIGSSGGDVSSAVNAVIGGLAP